jgi:hypothetical protein
MKKIEINEFEKLSFNQFGKILGGTCTFTTCTVTTNACKEYPCGDDRNTATNDNGKLYHDKTEARCCCPA